MKRTVKNSVDLADPAKSLPDTSVKDVQVVLKEDELIAYVSGYVPFHPTPHQGICRLDIFVSKKVMGHCGVPPARIDSSKVLPLMFCCLM